MPRFCAVFGCSNRSNRETDRKFYSFPGIRDCRGRDIPEGVTQREAWVKAIKRADLTQEKLRHASVCSDHFVSGRPAFANQKLHPDYAPTKEMGYGKYLATARYHRGKKIILEMIPEVPKRVSGFTCAMQGCSSSRKSHGSTISLFSFPTDQARCKQWVRNCNRLDLLEKSVTTLHKYYRVCGKHFGNNMFMNDLKNRLYPEAYPTFEAFEQLQDSETRLNDNLMSESPLEHDMSITDNPVLCKQEMDDDYEKSYQFDPDISPLIKEEIKQELMEDEIKTEKIVIDVCTMSSFDYPIGCKEVDDNYETSNHLHLSISPVIKEEIKQELLEDEMKTAEIVIDECDLSSFDYPIGCKEVDDNYEKSNHLHSNISPVIKEEIKQELIEDEIDTEENVCDLSSFDYPIGSKEVDDNCETSNHLHPSISPVIKEKVKQELIEDEIKTEEIVKDECVEFNTDMCIEESIQGNIFYYYRQCKQ